MQFNISLEKRAALISKPFVFCECELGSILEVKRNTPKS